MVANFSTYVKQNSEYLSPPFYTHPRGYKLYLSVFANGRNTGKGTHVSIYVTLMRGEYDDQLKWPFKGDVVVELRNWKEDKGHHEDTFSFPMMDGYYRVNGSSVDERKLGRNLFISHSTLLNNSTNTQYIQDDCLCLRVKAIAVYYTSQVPKIPSWQDPLTPSQSLYEFSLTEFPKRKQFDNQYYSTPFYTHPTGYKLCLAVDSKGYGSGKGTHVSVFVTVMKGEHDDQLQWPFKGKIVVEMVNWREDKGHREVTFDFSGIDIINRVTDENKVRGPRFGNQQFISHSSLPYNPTTNTEYLQDDCLRLRVKTVVL